MQLGIIGGGRAAWAFGSGWRAKGRPLAGVALRDGSTSELPKRLGAPRRTVEELVADSDVVLAAVADPALEEVATRLGSVAPARTLLFHASGALTSALFGGRDGAFSLHPLRSLPPAGTSVDLEGTLFVWEGAAATRDTAEEIARTLEGRFAAIPAGSKVLYHAAAVLASNDVAALAEIAREIMERAGLERQHLRGAIAELARSAIANWEQSPERFTGPVARGDAATVERHLRALAADDPERAELYRRLALEVARALAPGARDEPELSEIISLLRSRTLP
ncbi:MAG: DUF2520 domain-containing protein [Thermoanaerobaculia bacterium]